MFIYVFDGEQDKSKQMTDMIINPVTEELKHYVRWYGFDCNKEEIKNSKRFQMCDNPEYTPFLQLLKPAEMKINPYTNQPMSPSAVSF